MSRLNKMNRGPLPPRTHQAPPELPVYAATVERLLVTNREVVETGTMLAQEMMDFAGRRLRAQVEFMTTTPGIGSLDGLLEAQLRFMERASRDYAEEVNHIAQVLRKQAAAIRDEAPMGPRPVPAEMEGAQAAADA